MNANSTSIATSHGGNLPLPSDWPALLSGGDATRARLAARLPLAVAKVVGRQLELGLSVVNDGEYVKAASSTSGYDSYIAGRVRGWEDVPIDAAQPAIRAGSGERDRRQFPGFYASGLWHAGSGGPERPGFAVPGTPAVPTTERVCIGPVSYVGQPAIDEDIRSLRHALDGKPATGFIASLGPLSLGAGLRNLHYANRDDYMYAVAEVMREEYRAITDAGLVVQIDEPEFATAWMFYPDWSVQEYRRYLEFCVEVINHAIAGLPQHQVRLHVCWGSGHRPHVNDIGFRDIADLLVKVNAGIYAIEAGNVRHAHEWRVWEDVKLPEGRKLMPGVVSHATDLVEHPDLVAARLMNFAQVVGKENLMAGTDCGIGSRVGHEEIAWAKIAALTAGAAIASRELWSS